MMARVLNDVGAAVNPIVPWSVSGVFIAATLQVNPLAFVSFAFFPFIVTILAVLMGFVMAKSAKEMAIN